MSEISQEKLIQIAAAAEKLVRCKGRYHSEQNYRALAALFGVTTPDLPPLEGEALRERVEPVIPGGLHPASADLVLRFATALAEKLHKAEQKYGYSDNWQQRDWYHDCLQSLWVHIEKGDPRDVAAYCAFMWHHGWKTESAPPAAVVPDALEKFAEFMTAESIKAGDYPDGWKCKAANAAHEYAQACRAAMLEAPAKPSSLREGINALRELGGIDAEKILAERDALNECEIPDGWKLVPIEPTVEMQIAFAETWFSKVRCVDDCELEDAYIAMLAAAPGKDG